MWQKRLRVISYATAWNRHQQHRKTLVTYVVAKHSAVILINGKTGTQMKLKPMHTKFIMKQLHPPSAVWYLL